MTDSLRPCDGFRQTAWQCNIHRTRISLRIAAPSGTKSSFAHKWAHKILWTVVTINISSLRNVPYALTSRMEFHTPPLVDWDHAKVKNSRQTGTEAYDLRLARRRRQRF